MREMLIQTASETLRDIHRDVWRMAHAPEDRRSGRTFQFALFDADPNAPTRVLVRGALLPGRHCQEVPPLVAWKVYRFRADVRAVSRSDFGETNLPAEEIPAWMSARLEGMTVLDLRSGAVRTRPMDRNCTLGYHCVSGRVRIEDAARATLVRDTGIGRSKGFGFGMLILTPETQDLGWDGKA